MAEHDSVKTTTTRVRRFLCHREGAAPYNVHDLLVSSKDDAHAEVA
jgi:hypothetical protein